MSRNAWLTDVCKSHVVSTMIAPHGVWVLGSPTLPAMVTWAHMSHVKVAAPHPHHKHHDVHNTRAGIGTNDEKSNFWYLLRLHVLSVASNYIWNAM